MKKTQEILELLDRGFVPYCAEIPPSFYSRRACRKQHLAEWFTQPRGKSNRQAKYICLGCRRRCGAIEPAGWPSLVEERKVSRPGQVAFAVVDRLSVDDLLRLKRVLRVDEAAWALNVSRQKVHDWIEEGVLDAVPGAPVRVTCSSVERILLPRDAVRENCAVR